MKKGLILFFIISLLSACAQTPRITNIPWLKQQQQLEKLTNWSFRGKIAVITPNERHSLNIYWQQSHDNLHITLTTFLGITVLELHKTPQLTQIINNKGERFSGEDAQTLIQTLSGWVIPVDELQQWVKGNPRQASYQLNTENQLASLAGVDAKNALWSIDYSDYKQTKDIALPHKLTLKHLDIRLKFAISKWQVN